MHVTQVVSILDSLVTNVSPERFQSDEARDAISTASTLLKQRPAAAGARWSEEEDAQLLAEFDGGQALPGIARLHDRSRAAITLRLVKLGRIESDSVRTRQRS